MMTKKYTARKEYEGAEIVTAIPPYKRVDGGRFVLSQCTQRDLKFLHDVVRFEGVILAEDDSKEPKE